MSEAVSPERQRLAAQYLRELLLKPGPCRDAWQGRVNRPRAGVVNQLAVAETLAERLQLSEGAPPMPLHQLRDIVSGALSGSQLTSESLQLFVDGFGFADQEADRLRRLWAGSARIGVASGTNTFSRSTEQDVVEALGPRRHQTLSLHDHVYIAADGRIDQARMIQVLEAIAPEIDRIPFLCDTNVLTIEVGQGAKEVSGAVRQIAKDLYTTDIVLARTLDVGETITLEYWLTYRFPGDLENPAEREFRRGVFRHTENYNMRVEFSPGRLPARLWWGQWDGIDGDVLNQEDVALDSQHSAHCYVRSFEKTVVGFRWEW
ncbi:MAG TPA: hypothetical protein VGI58_01770 [Streptosporangiaceae bacterium]